MILRDFYQSHAELSTSQGSPKGPVVIYSGGGGLVLLRIYKINIKNSTTTTKKKKKQKNVVDLGYCL